MVWEKKLSQKKPQMIWINNTSTCYESLKIDKDKPKS